MYTTMSQTTMTVTFLCYQPVVGHHGATGAPSRTKDASGSQIDCQGHHLSPPTVRWRTTSCGTANNVHNPPQMSGGIPAKTPITLAYQNHPTASISRRSHMCQSSSVLHAIQGRSPVRHQPATNHCTRPAHHKDTSGLEAIASYEPEYGQ
jgi:hypothetical protein